MSNEKEISLSAPSGPAAENKQAARKQKYPRINLAFYADHLDYVQEAAWQNRTSVTGYVNRLIAEDRIRRAEEVQERISKEKE